MTAAGKNEHTAADQLRLFIERVERLKEEQKGLQDDVKDVFAEAKASGFDVPTMKSVMKLRKMEPHQRRSGLALIELYMTALGMSDGSLSDAAVAFLEERMGHPPEDEPEVDQSVSPPSPRPVAGGEGAEDAPPPPPPLTVDDARRLGREAAAANKPVTANPFPARDPRRAAWDEEWCKAAGSDGMEIPVFLQPPPKPDEGKGGGGAL